MAEYNTATLQLASAMTTVKFVQGKMVFGASNKLQPGLLAAAMCVGWGGMPGKMRQDVDKDLAAEGANWTWRRRIEIEAYQAKSWGCGNCGEQASAAFVYLREHGIKPIEYYYADDHKHAFVIIGRDTSTPENDFTKWNKEAVICDPWRGVAALVIDDASYLRGRELTRTHRED